MMSRSCCGWGKETLLLLDEEGELPRGEAAFPARCPQLIPKPHASKIVKIGIPHVRTELL